ncbi:Glycoside hydrolase family 37 [Trinorchestia longiramus]|nr:Glycoside hydrolase family 37 [Trinorchestia longiramus]
MMLKNCPGINENERSKERSPSIICCRAAGKAYGSCRTDAIFSGPVDEKNKYLEKKFPAYSGAMLCIVLILCCNAGLVNSQTDSGLPQPCDSDIYCYGDLLKTVQLSHIYNDSKYFVDMPMKFEPEVVQVNFQKLMEDTGNNPSSVQVEEFVSQNFDDPGAEFEDWTLGDWTQSPAFLNKIKDSNYRQFASTLVGLWKDLGRKISSTVSEEPQKYSQIYVENPVVVPGGRFREFYYWDSYWTLDGLLLSEMNVTVRGMLDNFLDLVRQYGLIPNGGRIYYIRRSQPPYLIPMVHLYVNATGDLQFVRDNIELMEQEFNFWLNNRTTEVSVNGTTYTLAQYNSRVDGPRPESYKEDYESAQNLPADQQTQLYVEYKSGAESGWDYSSRWFKKNGTNKGTLNDLAVTDLAPVDLNSLMCYNARLLSWYYDQLGNHLKAAQLEKQHQAFLRVINEVLWDDEDGVWYDFDIKTMQRRRYFYLSNLHPLWTESYKTEEAEEVVQKVVSYLQQQGVLDYVGGVPTSRQNTGEQWDYPNAWAPLQHLVVNALQKHKHLHPDADNISLQLASKWVRSNWRGYEDTKAMFEKYNVNLVGNPGHGGEYEVQLGFGWTNGVALRFMNDFGDRLSSVETQDAGTESNEAGTAETGTGSNPVNALSPTNRIILALLLPLFTNLVMLH